MEYLSPRESVKQRFPTAVIANNTHVSVPGCSSKGSKSPLP